MISSAPPDPGVIKPHRSFLEGVSMAAMPVSSGFSYKIHQVPRTHNVGFIGDSHGNHAGFRKNMEALGYVEHNEYKIPHNHRLVVLGDIVADRHATGIPILLDIDDIRAKGGKVDLIAGNHEDLLLSFLLQRLHINFLDPIELCQNRHVGVGLLEFSRFQSGPVQYWCDLSVPDILRGLRGSEEGQKILKILCSMKIGVQIDDTFFVHTDMTDAMAEMLLKYGIDTINEIFQRNMRSFLIEGKEEADSTLFHQIRDVFLSSYNGRETMNEDHIMIPSFSHMSADSLHTKYGINRIVHGHTDHGKYDNTGRLIEDIRTIVVGDEGILVTSVDHSAHKREGYRDHARSVGIIDSTNGTFYTYNH